MTIVVRAKSFAAYAHRGLCRPNRSRQNVVEHLSEVAELVKASGGDEYDIALGYLHDTVEDTDVTYAELEQEFGTEVALGVMGLTDDPSLLALPTFKRKLAQSIHIAAQSERVRRVKIADGTSNLRSVAVDPPLAWNQRTTLDYLYGCAVVTHVCRGVSPYLEDRFDEAFEAALKANL